MWGGWRFVLEGKYLYTKVDIPGATPSTWPNPPSFTFFTAPLGLLDIRTAAYLWFYLKLGVVIWVALSLKRLNDHTDRPAPYAVTVPVLLTACWLSYDFVLGHMNLIAIGLTIASLIAYVEKRRLPAMLYASWAILCKGPAIVLLPFYLFRRELRVLGGVVALCLVWLALPAVVWGPAKTRQYNRDFVGSVQFKNIYGDVEVGWGENWSLPALVVRLIGPVPPADRFGKTLDLLSWQRAGAEGAAMIVAALGIAALGLWWLRRPSRSMRLSYASTHLHYAALAATATLILSPVTRKAYLATLLFPYFVLWGFLLTTPASLWKRAVAALLVLSVALSYLTHSDLWGKPLVFIFERWHVITFSLLVLLAAQLLATRGLNAAEHVSDLTTRQ